MELLDQLEERISLLLAENKALVAENVLLKQARVDSSLSDENKTLCEELEKERARNKIALARVEALIERIKEQSDQA